MLFDLIKKSENRFWVFFNGLLHILLLNTVELPLHFPSYMFVFCVYLTNLMVLRSA